MGKNLWKKGSDQGLSESEDTLDAFPDHVVSKKNPPEKEHQIRAEISVTVSAGRLENAIAGIHGVIRDAMTALVTFAGHDRITRMDIRQQIMLQCPVNKIIYEKLNSVEIKSSILRKN